MFYSKSRARRINVAMSPGSALGGKLLDPVMATIHPSAILRAPDDVSRAHARAELVADLKKIARRIRGREPATPRRSGRASRAE
jgi:hypothetical protein